MSVTSSLLDGPLVSDNHQACAEHRLDAVNINTKPGSAVSVVLASQGYPGSYPKGKQITVGSVPSSEPTRPLNRCQFMKPPQTSSFSTLERQGPTTKSSHPEDESSRSQPMPKPFRLRCMLRIQQLKTYNSTAKRSVEISPTGHFIINRSSFRLLTCHTQGTSTYFCRKKKLNLRRCGGLN